MHTTPQALVCSFALLIFSGFVSVSLSLPVSLSLSSSSSAVICEGRRENDSCKGGPSVLALCVCVCLLAASREDRSWNGNPSHFLREGIPTISCYHFALVVRKYNAGGSTFQLLCCVVFSSVYLSLSLDVRPLLYFTLYGNHDMEGRRGRLG